MCECSCEMCDTILYFLTDGLSHYYNGTEIESVSSGMWNHYTDNWSRRSSGSNTSSSPDVNIHRKFSLDQVI